MQAAKKTLDFFLIKVSSLCENYDCFQFDDVILSQILKAVSIWYYTASFLYMTEF